MADRQAIPTWLYEPLPWLYLGAGILVAVNLRNIWGLVSGVLLASAGLMVWWIRASHRKDARDRAASRKASAGRPVRQHHAALVQLVWSDEYESGHPLIDAQHRKLFSLGNNLLNAILEKQAKLDVELLLDELISEVTNHFCTEEAILARAKHPLSPNHQDSHRELLSRCKDLAERYHQDAIKVGDLFQFIAIDVVSDHILKEDLKFLATKA